MPGCIFLQSSSLEHLSTQSRAADSQFSVGNKLLVSNSLTVKTNNECALEVCLAFFLMWSDALFDGITAASFLRHTTNPAFISFYDLRIKVYVLY